MNNSQFLGALQAELVENSCRTNLGISPAEEYYIPLSSMPKILRVAESLLQENFISKDQAAEVLARECSIGELLEACDLEIKPKGDKPPLPTFLDIFQ